MRGKRSQETGKSCASGSGWVLAGNRKSKKIHEDRQMERPTGSWQSATAEGDGVRQFWGCAGPDVGPPFLNPIPGNRRPICKAVSGFPSLS